MSLFCLAIAYSFDKHEPILIIFGRNVTEILVTYFTTSRKCLYLTVKTGNPEIASFHLNIACCFDLKVQQVVNVI